MCERSQSYRLRFQGQCFSVAIIPYTYEHTNFHRIKAGTVVNIEFDILGKYLSRMMHFAD